MRRGYRGLADVVPNLRVSACWRLLLAGVLAMLYALYLARVGPIMSPDSHWYADAGRRVSEGGFHLERYLEQSNASDFPVLYLGFPIIVAIAQRIFPAHWPLATAALNLIALVLTAYLAMRLVYQLTGRAVPVLLVFLLFATLGEQVYWIPYVVTDTTFQLLAFGVFILVYEAYSSAGRANLVWGLAWMATVLAVFYRPPGLWLPVWMLLVALTAGIWRDPNEQFRSARLRRYALWGGALFVSGMLIQAFAMVHMGDLGPRGMPVMDYLRDSFTDGVVVEGHETTFSAPPRSVLDFLLLMVKRVVYFFVFWAREFSWTHNAVNIFAFVPTYVLAAVALYHSFVPTGRLSREAQRTAVLAALFIAGFAVFHALTLIDHSWRYRLPCYPPLIVLAALGIHCLLAVPTISPRSVPSSPSISAPKRSGVE